MSHTYRAHKIEIRPTAVQIEFLTRSCGVRRFVYNQGLQKCKENYQQGIKNTRSTLCKWVTSHLRTEFPFLKEVSARTSASAIADLLEAYTRFCKGTSGYPKFRKKGDTESFAIRGIERFSIEGRKLQIERLATPIVLREELRFHGTPRQVTISRKANKWFAAVLVALDASELRRKPLVTTSCTGVDLGVLHLATLSTGEVFPKVKALGSCLKKIKRLQRKLQLKEKGSKNYKDLQRKIAETYYYSCERRKAATHEFTSYLIKNYKTICIEDLHVAELAKNNNNLAREIYDVGFYEIRRQLEYKSKENGNSLKVVHRYFPSSKLCSSCGTKKKEILLSRRVYECYTCGMEIDRDLNAALNIVAQGSKETKNESSSLEISIQTNKYSFSKEKELL